MFLQLTPIYIKPIKIPILYIVLCNNKKNIIYQVKNLSDMDLIVRQLNTIFKAPTGHTK